MCEAKQKAQTKPVWWSSTCQFYDVKVKAHGSQATETKSWILEVNEWQKPNTEWGVKVKNDGKLR